VREHDLVTLYKCENMDQTLKVLVDRLSTQIGREGILHIEALDRDPERAAAMVHSTLRILDEIQRETRRSRAADVARFIAARLDTTKVALAAAEDSLRRFEELHGLLAPEEQAAALVRTVATIEAERLAAVVERDALRSQFGATHPDVLRLDALVRSYGDARASLEGTGGRPAGAGPRALIELQRLPGLSIAYLRQLREVEIQTVLFELLTQMHEQYRIQEVQDTPTVQVLDPPVVPQEKARPHRSILCIVATLLAFLVSTAVAATLERVAVIAEADPERYALLARLVRGIGLGFILARHGDARR
jgi:capsule polysaccharide export protein KpsE/RkpR